MRIQVKDFMSTPAVTAEGDCTVLEIRDLMQEKNIHAVPIVSYSEKDRLHEMTIIGIVTATDLNKEMDDQANIQNVMTASTVHVVQVDSSAQEAAKIMLKNNVHHIVAMNDGEIVGMLSGMDFVELVAEHNLD